MNNFSEKIFNVFGEHTSHNVSPYKNNNLIYDVQMGKKLKNKKKNNLKSLRKDLRIIENLDTRKDLKDKNLQSYNSKFSKLEGTFNDQLNKYNKVYTDFMSTYNERVRIMNTCETECAKKQLTSSTGFSEAYYTACKAGCRLNGPYIKQCDDTYNQLGTDPNNTCISKLEKITDLNNGVSECNSNKDPNILKGYKMINANLVNSSDYKDSTGLTVAEGCCKCGGGSGGPPSYTLSSGEIITSCEELLTHFNTLYPTLTDEDKNEVMSLCKVDGPTKDKLWKKYKMLNQMNDNMMNISQNLLNLITDVKENKNKINKNIDDVNSEINSQLSTFTHLYPQTNVEIDETLNAQLEDIQLNEQSMSIKYYIWTILAITMSLITIHQIKN